ncbi:MAG TPA: acyl-CoA synthetase FdrA [Caldisericia bacterium]|nr:acyl-CoA synthetase FdrA [Caldisericia bacterium]HRU73820.1 acyl-CoA synthetase FdrA [Caldisericia bacterium]
MAVKGLIKSGEYFDSVTLMLVSRDASSLPGVIDAAVVMGTKENKSILESSGMLLPEFKDTKDSDLLIVVKSDDEKVAEESVKKIEEMLKKSKQRTTEGVEFLPKSIEGALQIMPDANLVIISVAGRYAADIAMDALKRGLHVMIFSDNVPKEKAIEVKKYGYEHDLLVMGPDCGTAIINGAPLGFANVVNRGDIGIVSAAGTGLQEVSCTISNNGGGISQGIGTGGIDVKKDYGALSFLKGLEALRDDPETKIIVLVSKPPHPEILEKIGKLTKDIKKPIVGILLGADSEVVKSIGAIPAKNLEEGALLALSLSKGIPVEKFQKELKDKEEEIKKMAEELSKKLKPEQKYFRGFFQGGTLTYETQVILKDFIGPVNSNAPLDEKYKLKDSWKSEGHTIVDLGEDEFTVGRPHPMIDFSLRNKRLIEESKFSDVAIFYLDVVIGYGSNMTPKEELVPAILEAKKNSNAIFIVTVCGTDKDPQNKKDLIQALKETGAVVFESNASASKLAGYILKDIGGK